jgi:hypothetical protein
MPKATKNPGSVRFVGTIEGPKESWGGDAWVVFPYDLTETFGIDNWVPVIATIDGKGFRSSLHKMNGRPVVHVFKAKWRKLRKGAGMRVDVSVTLYEQQRLRARESTPQDLRVAMLRRPPAFVTFRKLPYSHQRDYLYWINESTRKRTRERRIARAVEMLAEGKRLTSRGVNEPKKRGGLQFRLLK